MADGDIFRTIPAKGLALTAVVAAPLLLKHLGVSPARLRTLATSGHSGPNALPTNLLNPLHNAQLFKINDTRHASTDSLTTTQTNNTQSTLKPTHDDDDTRTRASGEREKSGPRRGEANNPVVSSDHSSNMSLLNSIFGADDSVAGLEPSTKQKGEQQSDVSSGDLFDRKVQIPEPTPENDAAETKEEERDATPNKEEDGRNKKSKEELDEEEARTIFVGNLPPSTTRRSLASIFKHCGKVSSTRLRSMATDGVKLAPEHAGNQNLVKKVAANLGKMLEADGRKSAQGYVVFASLDSVEKALEMNNTEHAGFTLRVDRAKPTNDASRSVFVGNLPYAAEEETLRSHFETYLAQFDVNERDGSAVSGVRLIRDKETQQCKGIGYIMLRDATLVSLALGLHESKYMRRELRVQVCGKRYKSTNNVVKKKRAFEGLRATSGGSSRKSNPDEKGGNVGNAKRRRSRSEKSTAPGKAGVSKRAATEQKVNKRVKKLQKRATKGMGKKKN